MRRRDLLAGALAHFWIGTALEILQPERTDIA
jgi:hypothetical protein